MGKLGRAAPLPPEFQGRWIVVGEPTSELIVDGGEITCFGRAVEYDYKEIIEAEGAVTVRLAIDDLANEDTFQRTNITSLVKTPESEFHVYNVKFACQVVRANS